MLEAIEDMSNDNERHLKYKEIFNELPNERISEIYNIIKKIINNFNNLTYHSTDSNTVTIHFMDL